MNPTLIIFGTVSGIGNIFCLHIKQPKTFSIPLDLLFEKMLVVTGMLAETEE